MTRLILSRLAVAIVVVFVMTALSFVLISLIPGNAATTILGQDATPEKIATLNRQLGLDRPLWQQYGDWLVGVFHGSLGTSLYTGEAVGKLMLQRAWPTIFVAGFATIAATIVGVAIGTYAAVRNGVLARILNVLAMLGISLPNFWIALLLIVLIGRLRWLPTLGYTTPTANLGDWAAHLVLPVTSLAIAGVAIIAKQTRDAVGEGLSREFVRFFQANGIPRTALVLRHGLRYAAMPIVASIGACFINLFGGTVALESVFSIPGLGALVATSTAQHDLTAIQGAVLAYTIVILIVTLVSDVLYASLNPKVRAR